MDGTAGRRVFEQLQHLLAAQRVIRQLVQADPGRAERLLVRHALGRSLVDWHGKEYDPQAPPRQLMKGKRYRLVFDNQTDDPHPVHLHRNSFELTSVYGKPTAGVLKDVVLVKGYRKIEVDVTPEQEGLTLFHCHQQLHMDYGFKTLFNVV